MVAGLLAAGALVIPACGGDDASGGGSSGTDAGPETGTTGADASLPDTGNGAVDAGADTGIDAGPSCTGGTTLCNGKCVDLKTDTANCGQCGTACTGGKVCTSGDAGAPSCQPVCTAPEQNCGGTCANVQTSNTHCGACNAACAATEVCGTGTCSVRLVGNGADGAYAPTADETINTVRSGGAAGTTGTKDVTVADVTGFAVNQLVLIHQSRGTGAGQYEYATIAAIDAANKKLTMVRNLTNTYASGGDVDRAQVVRVQQYTTVDIPAGVTVTAPAWDGDSGGILAIKATGAVNVTGAIRMDGRGYRGYSHAGTCAGGARYVCTAADTANGFTGESYVGPSAAGYMANGSGGGGGQDGQDCGMGGGGAYGAGAANGPDGSNGGACRAGAQLSGLAGAEAGNANLDTSLFFGGAGGEGGADEDGAYPGAGGNGGGIVLVDAASVTVTGAITSSGANGGNGVQNDPGCGGSGCGMGGGGGGAGGAIHIQATGAVDVGTNLVTAGGGTGGACTCGYPPAGSAGVGRIGVAGGTVNGATTPAFDAN